MDDIKIFINELQNEIIYNTTKSCENNVSNLQTINFSNMKLIGCDALFTNINQTIETSASANCFNSEEFKQAFEKSTGDLVVNSADTKYADLLKNILVKKENINDITSCMSRMMNNQDIGINNIEVVCPKKDGKVEFSNISQAITSSVLTECLKENTEFADAIENIEKIEKELKDYYRKIIFSILSVTLVLLVVCFLLIMFFRSKITEKIHSKILILYAFNFLLIISAIVGIILVKTK